MSLKESHCSSKTLEVLSKLRLMDDDFMSKVFDQNVEVTQLLLNVVLQRKDFKVISVTAQREFKTVAARSVRFDVYATDSAGKHYDIEIQRSDKGASPQRARYNSSVLDTSVLQKGEDYYQLNETYVIFITENDVLGKGLPLYHIERTMLETNELFGDGSHIIFVNGKYDNQNDDIGKLMHDFRCTSAEEMHYDQLAERVRYFKEEGGMSAMCKLIEDMRKDAATERTVEIVLNMFKKNMSIEKIAECCDLSLEEVQKIKEDNKL